MYISTPLSPEVENFQMKIYNPAGNQTPDLLNQRQTCYHLSQHGELYTYKLFVPNANPLHYYVFGFHARQINGVKFGLFSNHARLGQTALHVG